MRLLINGQAPVKTWTAYDGQQVYADFEGSGALKARYLTGPLIDELLAKMDASGSNSWYLTDRLGTVRDRVDASNGNVLNHLKYSSFGEVTYQSASNDTDRFKFTGRDYDMQTKLSYHRARYLDTPSGRWTTEDPIGFAAGDFNLYRYVGNSAANYVDPSGLMGERPFDNGLFWDQVDNLRPGWSTYFRDGLGWTISGKDMGWWGWVPFMKHRESDANERVAYLDRGWNELEAAQAFVDEMEENNRGQVSVFNDLKDGSQLAIDRQEATKRRAFAEAAQWVADNFKRGAQVVAIFNPGVNLALTIDDIDKRGLQAEHLLIVVPVGTKITDAAKRLRSKLGSKSVTIKDAAGKVLGKADEVAEGLTGAKKTAKVLDSVPSVRDGAFNKWFNELTPDELDQIWKNPKLRDAIEDRLRHPGGLHEWHLVARTPVFKRWGLTADQIKEMRTLISETNFVNPVGRHGGKGSTMAHNELLDIIDSSINYEMFVRRLQNWANYRLKGGAGALPPGLRQ